MTAEDWKDAEKMLSTILGHIKLRIDGYNVSIGYVKETPTKYCLAVYIDGVFKSEWLINDCEIRKRFCRKIKKQVLSSKEKSKLINEIGKKAFELFCKENPNKLYYTYYEPYFGSFRTLKAHLIKNNLSIELVREKVEI